MNRRQFLAASVSTALLGSLRGADAGRPPRILLRSSWQTVNIGDIAHTPGVLRLLEEHFPAAEVRLWPSNVGDGVEAMLRRRFPNLVIVQGSEAQRAAFAECDFLLHGSGPSLVASKDVERWRRETGKLYGVFGITVSAVDESLRELLSGARFVFFRDSVSLTLARERGVSCPVMAFGPDGAFAADVRDDARAAAFLAARGLEPGKFLCCIPRYRYTPYWEIHSERPKDAARHARNEEMKERDHAPLRAAIIAVARETPLKILLCPEDRTQVALGRAQVLDQLPADVRDRVVWRESYWLTDEAISTYVQSAGLFGLEMHSPIMCIGHGVPALVGRFAEQTSKGIMWRDVGLGDWLFDWDDANDMKRFVPTVLALARNPAAARAQSEGARALVRARQREMVSLLRQSLRP